MTPHPLHLQKWTMNLFFKSNKIQNHVTNFKTLPQPPFYVDVMNAFSIKKIQI